MSTIEHLFEPSRLFLVWHHLNGDTPQHRRVVGELIRQGDDASFRYLKGTEDFKAAVNEGFLPFPAFSEEKSNEFQSGALDVFVRRLPPRKREDFKEYLSQYSLPQDFSGSAFSLLAYTGARLASDGFELCPDLSDASAPLDFVIEVSGVQHYIDENYSFSEDDEILFEVEPENPHDKNAIKVVHKDKTVGYVNKALSPSFAKLLSNGEIEGKVLKFSVQKSRQRLLVLVRYL